MPFLTCSKAESKERNHHINGDGFGVAWYDDESPTYGPCVFTSTKPSWNDRNLGRLAQHIRSNCIFAHVRAASADSGITESNCHPFKFGNLVSSSWTDTFYFKSHNRI